MRNFKRLVVCITTAVVLVGITGCRQENPKITKPEVEIYISSKGLDKMTDEYMDEYNIDSYSSEGDQRKFIKQRILNGTLIKIGETYPKFREVDEAKAVKIILREK